MRTTPNILLRRGFRSRHFAFAFAFVLSFGLAFAFTSAFAIGRALRNCAAWPAAANLEKVMNLKIQQQLVVGQAAV